MAIGPALRPGALTPHSYLVPPFCTGAAPSISTHSSSGEVLFVATDEVSAVRHPPPPWSACLFESQDISAGCPIYSFGTVCVMMRAGLLRSTAVPRCQAALHERRAARGVAPFRIAYCSLPHRPVRTRYDGRGRAISRRSRAHFSRNTAIDFLEPDCAVARLLKREPRRR